MSLSTPASHYGECHKAHPELGGKVDGCQEFRESSIDPLICLICGCHQGFHQKVPAIPNCKTEVVYMRFHEVGPVKPVTNRFIGSLSGPVLKPSLRTGSLSGPVLKPSLRKPVMKEVVYGGCFKNHSDKPGDTLSDGCCSFIPSSGDSTEQDFCAGCKCHKSFHLR